MHEIFYPIKGQSSALKILSKIFSSGRIPNALLFSGSEGVGKYFAAIQFLKLLNGNSANLNLKISNIDEPFVKLIVPLPRGKGEANNDLPLDKLSSDVIDEINEQFNLKAKNPYHLINIKNANNIKINSIREINKIISLNFDEIKYRGIIISDAHNMSIEAQNAFLKNLEEPPEGVIFILISSQPEELLITIKSRCWNVNFSPLMEEDLTDILNNYFNYSAELIKTILPFAYGSVSNAVYLLENDFEKYLHKAIIILRYALAKKYFTATKEFTSLLEQNQNLNFKILIDLFITWFNDTLKSKYNLSFIRFKDYEDSLIKFNSRFSEADINKIVTKLNEYKDAIDKNVNLNLTMMNVIFELASIGMKVNERQAAS
jgi:DNA polymerase III subunit delta'